MSLRLKEILKDRGESITAFALKVGITQANMSNIVNGKSSPTLDTLERIASALNVPITELFEKENTGDIIGFVKVGDTVHEVKSAEDVKDLAERL
ncbi:helix-turn-helix domain-containing protein [Butyricimonas paravirosa]|uniref:helix-turn-helix domain-containing protein n=1 Tax=Butyricimonas paravirosa TaxID=1472417 RepID=UPI0026DFC989|nr:helix-turn-helix transcriptional regulator [uncultured Butyricimonas sp.]